MTTRELRTGTDETGTGDGGRASVGGGRARASFVTMLALSVGVLGPAGCRQAPPANTRAVIIDGNAGPDPAAANLAPADGYAAPVRTGTGTPTRQPVRVLGAQAQYAPQQNAESYPASGQALPAYSGQAQGGELVPPPPSANYDTAYDKSYDTDVNAGYQALEEAAQPPPPLPEYEQPPAPEPNTIWTPGYWNYANAGYFWVPGAWVGAPYAGALWTPGYWDGYGRNRYRFHHGFWARHIGFYGGVNYGCGYTGSGYEGGYWRGNDFFYNRAVNRVNVTNIHNVYERNITINNITRVSYNGGNGGLQARPRPQEIAVLREQRLPAMATQLQIRQEAAQNRQQFYAENHGRPAVTVAARPVPAALDFHPPAGQTPVRVQPVQALDARAQQRQRTMQEPVRAQGVPDQPVHRNALIQPMGTQQHGQEQQHGLLLQQQREQGAEEQNRRQQEAQRGAMLQQPQRAQETNQQPALQQQQRVVQQQQQQQQRAAEEQHRTQQQQPGIATDQQRGQPQRMAAEQQQVQQQRLQQQQAEAMRQQESARQAQLHGTAATQRLPQQGPGSFDLQRGQVQPARPEANPQRMPQPPQRMVPEQQRSQPAQPEAIRPQEAGRPQHGNERQPMVQPRAMTPAPTPVRPSPAPPQAAPPQRAAPAQQPQTQSHGNEGRPSR